MIYSIYNHNTNNSVLITSTILTMVYSLLYEMKYKMMHFENKGKKIEKNALKEKIGILWAF